MEKSLAIEYEKAAEVPGESPFRINVTNSTLKVVYTDLFLQD